MQQLTELMKTCMDEYVTTNYNPTVTQFRKQITELQASRDEWKAIASDLRKKVGDLVIEQRNSMKRKVCIQIVIFLPNELENVFRFLLDCEIEYTACL